MMQETVTSGSKLDDKRDTVICQEVINIDLLVASNDALRSETLWSATGFPKPSFQ